MDWLRSPQAKGVSNATITKAMGGLSFDPDAITAEQTQPEFSTPIWDYIAGLVDDERIADGREVMHEWHHWLTVAQDRYGVNAAIIASIWGVESDFGKGFGNHPIVQSLASLSCAGGRERYFRTEFVAALKIIDAGDVDPAKFIGSWAGAFGHTQFMPTTFLKMAVDLDGDGHRDLITSVPDALGSTANYLHEHGWIAGEPWGLEVKLPAGYAGPSGRREKRPVATGRLLILVDRAEMGQKRNRSHSVVPRWQSPPPRRTRSNRNAGRRRGVPAGQARL